MKTLKAFLSIEFLLLCITTCYSKRGFILTAPKVIDAGSTVKFTFTAFDELRDDWVFLYLKDDKNRELSRTSFFMRRGRGALIGMDVPLDVKVPRARLIVNTCVARKCDSYDMKEVRIRHSSVLTLVQTDKPIYKPGQTVKFRILPMDSQLRSLKSTAVGDVWIEDPSGIRVAQWRKIEFKEGMVQLELPLSNEPPLGLWNIKTDIENVPAKQSFEVQKYVLPKFEVTIETLPIITTAEVIIPVKICARYTFEKKVEGKLETNVTFKRMGWKGDKNPQVEQSELISGCCNITVNARDLQMKPKEEGSLEFFAQVIENGTGIVGNATITKNVIKPTVTIDFLGTEDPAYFKPGIPFYGQAQVKKIDGQPATDEKISVCLYNHDVIPDRRWNYYGQPDGKDCKIFTTDHDGRFQFSIAPQSSAAEKVVLVAEAEVKYVYLPEESGTLLKHVLIARSTLILRHWHSPTDNYLQIQSNPDELECDRKHRIKVRYAGEMGDVNTFYSEIMSKGRIVEHDYHRIKFFNRGEYVWSRRYDFEGRQVTENDYTRTAAAYGEFDINFNFTAAMSPIARVLVFFVRSDGEVVADSRKFRVKKCFPNKVNLYFQHKQQYPGTETSLLLSATPNSVCGIGLVDKSVILLKPKKQLNIEKIFDIMAGFDVDQNTWPRQALNRYCPQMSRFSSSERPPYSCADSSTAFEEAGMVAITHFELETRPCRQRQKETSGSDSGSGSSTFQVNFYLNTAYRNFDSIFGRATTSAPTTTTPAPTTTTTEPIFTSTPEEIPELPTSEEIRSYFPETWLWEMQTVGENGETELQRKLPHTITQWSGRAVCVHPIRGLGISEDARITVFQPFFVDFLLPYSVVRGEVLPITVTVFNYLTKCLPITLALKSSDEYEILSTSSSHTICVCGEQSASRKFVLKPTALGVLNITVLGYSLESNVEVCGNESTARLNARDGVAKELKVEAEGIPKEEVTNYFICPKSANDTYETKINLMPPDNVVEGSARAFVSISADLMAQALNSLQKLVNFPKGCGEQNMVLFTPNIFVLDYLTATNRKTQEIENECIQNMKIGYQKEITYRHKNGAFSCFGEKWDKEGSLWLTAFVIKSFCQAARFVDIDKQSIQMSIDWVLKNQLRNGCFQTIGTVHNKELKGGLTDGERSLAPLTAYVLISMVESGMVRFDQSAARNAVKCLQEDTNPNLYALSLYAYACALTREKVKAFKYLQLLDDKAVNEGEHKHWSCEGRGQKSDSISVEIAGYYILARLELEKERSTEIVLPVVRWITKQRNSEGGFISTQDTIIALQALAKYASIQSQGIVDLNVTIKADSFDKEFELNEDNRLVTQNMQIPGVPTVVDLKVTGRVCALVQFSFRYNVKSTVGSDAFDLNIAVDRVGSARSNLLKIGICMRYKIVNETSNMVVIYAKMVSGFRPEEESLKKLQSERNISLKRYEVEENVVNLYFDQLTSEQICFTFCVQNEMEVENIKPQAITIQDYYTPELQVTKEYSVPIPKLPLPPLAINSDEGSGFIQ